MDWSFFILIAGLTWFFHFIHGISPTLLRVVMDIPIILLSILLCAVGLIVQMIIRYFSSGNFDAQGYLSDVIDKITDSYDNPVMKVVYEFGVVFSSALWAMVTILIISKIQFL